MKLQLLTFLLLTLLLSSTTVHTTMAGVAKKEGYCAEKCENRCSKAGVKDRCMKYCGICCDDCKCVPSANKHECPCYRDKTDSKGKPKCP